MIRHGGPIFFTAPGLEAVALIAMVAAIMGVVKWLTGVGTGALTAGLMAASLPSNLEESVRTVKSVGAEGKGNAEASVALRTLASAKVESVPGLLEAMDGANDYSLNWLRAAVETVVQREAAAGHKVSVAELETFLLNKSHHPRARRLAYEVIRANDPDRAARLLPGFLNDPAPEMRRDAVGNLAQTAATQMAAGDKTASVSTYRRALGFAREADQIDELAKKLSELGEKVDLREAFGWVTRWKVIGPFDNTGGTGFTRPFPPEETIDFAAEYEGKGTTNRWQEFETRDDYGLVDFNRPFSPLKEVAAYAWTEFWSDSARTVQIRLGSENGWKVWVNGQLLFGRDEYHRASEMDQYRLPVELKAGRNTLLVKCCQNEQVEDWTKGWEFQLRVTDAEGTPVRSTK